MRQRKLKQRKSKQSKSLAKILTLGIATATFVSSMSVPGGLLAPEKVYAEDAAGETVIGASVMVKGTKTGTVTDFDGTLP